MRTDYFDDLLADVVTPVTPARKQGVTGDKDGKPRNRADSAPLLHPLHLLHPETGSPEHSESNRERNGRKHQAQRCERPALFEYQLADNPGAWLVMISPAGADLERAWRRLLHQFGDRVLEVRERPES